MQKSLADMDAAGVEIVFGSDYPYRTSLDHVRGLRVVGLFDEATLAMIERQTALALLPALRRA